jgi:hypothetical protein
MNLVIPDFLKNQRVEVTYENEPFVYIFVFDNEKLVAMSGLDYDDTIETLHRLLNYLS